MKLGIFQKNGCIEIVTHFISYGLYKPRAFFASNRRNYMCSIWNQSSKPNSQRDLKGKK